MGESRRPFGVGSPGEGLVEGLVGGVAVDAYLADLEGEAVCGRSQTFAALLERLGVGRLVNHEGASSTPTLDRPVSL